MFATIPRIHKKHTEQFLLMVCEVVQHSYECRLNFSVGRRHGPHSFTISVAIFSQVIGLQSKDEALFSVTAWKSTLLIQVVIYLSPEYCHGPCSLINRELLTISFYMDQSPRKFLEPVDIRGGPCHCTFTNAGCNYYQEAGMPFCVHCMPSNWYNSRCSCPCRACDLSDTDWSGTDEQKLYSEKAWIVYWRRALVAFVPLFCCGFFKSLKAPGLE